MSRLRLSLRKSRTGDVTVEDDVSTSSSTVVSLPSGERLERNQEREDAGAHRGNKGQEQEHHQDKDDKHNLGGWRQLLQLLKRLFQVHGFPFLSFSGILRQTSRRRSLTRRTCLTISRASQCVTERIAGFGGRKVVL